MTNTINIILSLMSIKNISSFAASIINIFILIFYLIILTLMQRKIISNFIQMMKVLSIMYHRFDENKYPSTNIRMEVFYEHIHINKKFKF